jgi:hypothetical protein
MARRSTTSVVSAKRLIFVLDIQPSNNAGTSPAGLPNSSFVIGRSNHDANQWFTGLIDEFRVTKGTALWTSAFTPPTRRNLSAPVVDRSGSNNGGNFATTEMTDDDTYRVGEVIRPVDSAVWDFDGTDDCIKGGKGCRVGNTRRKSIDELSCHIDTVDAMLDEIGKEFDDQLQFLERLNALAP